MENERSAPRGGPERGRFVYLLDIDRDLAAQFDMPMRIAIRPVVTARVQNIPRGRFDLRPLIERVPHGPGLLLLQGVVELDTRVGDRTVSELLGAGDLLGPWHLDEDHPLLVRETMSVALTSLRVALLDEAFAQRVRAWPRITDELIQRATRRSMDLNAQRAATSHPRADVRVALLLWHLAERWGRVQPEGVLLSLPLTHRLISRLVGVERPSVSHALSRLSEGGLVERCEGGLMLRGTAEHHLACLTDRADREYRAQA